MLSITWADVHAALDAGLHARGCIYRTADGHVRGGALPEGATVVRTYDEIRVATEMLDMPRAIALLASDDDIDVDYWS